MQSRLPIFEVAEEWYKSRSDNRPAEDLLGWLALGFWGGQIKLYQPGSQTVASRKLFLEALRDVAGGSGIAFYEGEAAERTTFGSDEAIAYDNRTQIVLPADAREWSADLLERAYAILAAAPIDHYPMRFLQGFRAHEVSRDEFGLLCDKRGWERPSFWFGPRPRKTASSVDPECRSWLAAELQGGRRRPKAHYAKIARSRFATPVSRFNKIWAELAPPSWHQPGRIPKKLKR